MDLFFDITIMGLLLVTIVYAVRLNGKLNAIRNHKVELKANIEAFYKATEKANKAVTDLQKQGKAQCNEIDQKISNARKMSDEIDFMLTRARKAMLAVNEPGEKVTTIRQPKTQPAQAAPKLTREQQIERRLRAANTEIVQDNDGYTSLSEQQLLKAMRDREYKQALMG